MFIGATQMRQDLGEFSKPATANADDVRRQCR